MFSNEASMKVNKFTVNDLEQHIHALLLDFPTLQDDEELRRDTLEGNTTFHEIGRATV